MNSEKVAEYKINTKFSCISVHYQSKKELKDIIAFMIESKIIKYLGMNLTKEVRDLYIGNYKTILKEKKKI